MIAPDSAANCAAPGASVLVLWDIDYTLIAAQGFGRAVYERAFLAATGRTLGELGSFAGRTDLATMRDTLLRNGIEPTDTALCEFAALIVAEFERARAELACRGRVLPGAYDTLVALGADAAVFQGVLTGNLRAVARLKLEVFGLDAHVDLEASAYGDDHVERSWLVGYAQERAARRFDLRFGTRADSGSAGARTVLIGDTPNDVRAALHAGVDVIGVATGENGADELRAAGARTVLTALDPNTVLRLVLE